MKVKNIVRKAVALGSGATLVATSIAGALAYDLSTYPAKYIVDGQFDGKIVVGEKAATADVLGSIDIAASLQGASVSKVPVPGAAGTVTLSGDNYKVGTGSDQLELRESVGNVADTISKTELTGLKSGKITTAEGQTDYHQFLRLQSSDNPMIDMTVNYVRNKGVAGETVADYLIVPRDTGDKAFIEWEVQFPQGLESEIDATADTLPDLEDKTLNIMGTDYTIVSADYDGTSVVDLTLMGGSVPDTLREGETKTYTINGVDYEVTLVFVSDPSTDGGQNEAKFSVNGELTDAMGEGDTEILSGGLQIGVRDILVNSREGVASFFLGADKLELHAATIDGEYADSEVTVNDDATDSDVFAVTASEGTDTLEITSMKYRVFMDSKEGTAGIAFVPKGHGVKELMEEPNLLVSDTLDVRYEGLTAPKTADVLFDPVGDDQYDLTFTNVQGKEYTFTLMTNDAGTVKYGELDNELVFIEPDTFVAATSATYFIDIDDTFIVGKDSGEDKSVTNVLQYTDYKRSQHQVELTEVDGNTVTATINPATGLGTFSIGGHSYTVEIDTDDVETSDPSIAVDLDGDGTIGDGDEKVDITTFGGTIISLADAADETGTGFWVTVPEKRFDSAAGNAALGGEEYNVSISEINTDELQVEFDSASYAGPISTEGVDRGVDFLFETETKNSDVSMGMTDYGTLITQDESGDQNVLTLTVPEQQRTGQVFITMGSVSSSEGGAGSADKVNPIAVGLAVLDKDAPAIGSENLIIVGGPCANTVAAAFMGNPAQCGEGFEAGKAMIVSSEKNGKVAILVAGYEATETLGASRVLASYKDYKDKLKGEQVEVVVADLNDITVKAK